MDYKEIALRLIIAIIIGGSIGYERRNRSAGFRTNILVCVGACVVSIIQVISVNEALRLVQYSSILQDVVKVDMGRMGAQVISGIGFIGAGAIIQEKGSVRGLTTAASLWVVACIGLAIGLGYYFLSLIAAVSVVIVLYILKKFEDKFLYKYRQLSLEIKYKKDCEITDRLLNLLQSKGIRIKNIEFSVEEEVETKYVTCNYTVIVPSSISIESLISDLCRVSQVVMVEIKD